MKLELVGLVSHSEVALSDPVPAGLEGHLVPGQPALVAHHGSSVDGRAVDVVVDVAAQVEVVALVGRLDLAALLAGGNPARSLVRKGLMAEQRSSIKSILTQCLERRRNRTSASAPWSTEQKERVETITTSSPNCTSRLQKKPRETRRNETPPTTWSSRVISVPRVLSVFHFSVKVSPCSAHLYFVSRDPDTLLVSVLAEPVLVNSCGVTEAG